MPQIKRAVTHLPSDTVSSCRADAVERMASGACSHSRLIRMNITMDPWMLQGMLLTHDPTTVC